MRRSRKTTDHQGVASPSRIHVRNRQRAVRLDLRPLQCFADRVLTLALSAQPKPSAIADLPTDLFVWLISDRRMALLHQQFMNEPGPTDVITFQHGEIFVSVETARRQSRQFRTSTVREIELYIVHGILHLQGFDDHSPSQRSRMRAAEAALLRQATV
ncbi:MAG: rRNA maturation RNase YbeY [Chthoniobacterales bacterium]|jgi:probable rRNA maturation factor